MRTRRAARPLASLATLAAALAAVALLAGAAAADVSQTDPSGDAGAGSDITAVAATHDAARIMFRVTTLNPTVEKHAVWIFIDADANQATGGSGFEYRMRVSPGPSSPVWEQWDGTRWVMSFVVAGFAVVQAGSTTVEFQVPRNAIGNPVKLDFYAYITSIRDVFTPTVDVDRAPDSGVYRYEFAAPKPPVTLNVGAARVAPARPRAGAAVTVTAPATGVAAGAKVACSARIAGGGALKTTATFGAGRAVCKFKLPATARNRTVRGRVSVTSAGTSAGAAFAFKTAA